MKEKLSKLEGLYKLNEYILSTLEMDKLLEITVDVLQRTFGVDACAILFLDEKSRELYIRYATGYTDEARRNFRTTVGGPGVTGHVAATLEPLFIPDTRRDSRYVRGAVNENAKCEAALPLHVDKRLIGVLDIEGNEEYAFTDDDFYMLKLFAGQISLAIYNSLVFDSERKKANRLRVLNEIRNRISLHRGLQKILEVTAESVVELLGYYHILIFLWDEENQELRVVARAGEGIPELGKDQEDLLAAKIMEKSFYYDRTLVIRDQKTRFMESGFNKAIQSELVLPLKIQKSFVGAFYVSSERNDAFDSRDIRVLEAIRDQLNRIIKEAAVYSNISKRSKQIEIMHKIGRVAIQRFDFKRFVDDTALLIRKTFGFCQVLIFSYEKISEQLELLTDSGVPMRKLAVGGKVSIDDGVAGFVVRSGRYYLCHDINKDNRFNHDNLATKSELALPIKHKDELLGVLMLESPKLNDFDKSDVRIFNRIADQVAYTIVNAELFRQKSTAHNLLLNLNNLSREINASFDIDKSIGLVIRHLPDYLGCRICSLFFYYPDEHRLELMGHNLPGMMSSGMSFNASQNVLMNRVIQLRKSIFVKDIESELNIQNNPQYRTKSFLNIILKTEERILGVVNLTDKIDNTSFSSQEFYLVNSFAEHLAVAIDNAQKYGNLIEMSVTDSLTGLYVHRYFQETLDKEIARSERYGSALSMIMADIDNFSLYNDRFGHHAGDFVLRELGALIRAELREYDIAARFGGEEFVIILPNTSLLQAKVLADRLQKKIREFVPENAEKGTAEFISISQGISEYDFGIGKNEFIHRADMALLKAKAMGKNRVAVYSHF